MQCTNCNAELEPGAKFCDNCGAPVPAVPDDSASDATVLVSKPVLEPEEPEALAEAAASLPFEPEESAPLPTPAEEWAPLPVEPEEPVIYAAGPIGEIEEPTAPERLAEVFSAAPAVEEGYKQPEPQDFPYVSPPVSSQPETPYIPPAASPFPEASYIPPAADEKVLGMDASTAGIIALGLGIFGVLFSCVGCGALFSLLGAVSGAMALRTSSGKTTGLIGLILSIVGLLIALAVICIFSSIFITNAQVTY